MAASKQVPCQYGGFVKKNGENLEDWEFLYAGTCDTTISASSAGTHQELATMYGFVNTVKDHALLRMMKRVQHHFPNILSKSLKNDEVDLLVRPVEGWTYLSPTDFKEQFDLKRAAAGLPPVAWKAASTQKSTPAPEDSPKEDPTTETLSEPTTRKRKATSEDAHDGPVYKVLKPGQAIPVWDEATVRKREKDKIEELKRELAFQGVAFIESMWSYSTTPRPTGGGWVDCYQLGTTKYRSLKTAVEGAKQLQGAEQLLGLATTSGGALVAAGGSRIKSEGASGAGIEEVLVKRRADKLEEVRKEFAKLGIPWHDGLCTYSCSPRSTGGGWVDSYEYLNTKYRSLKTLLEAARAARDPLQMLSANLLDDADAVGASGSAAGGAGRRSSPGAQLHRLKIVSGAGKTKAVSNLGSGSARRASWQLPGTAPAAGGGRRSNTGGTRRGGGEGGGKRRSTSSAAFGRHLSPELDAAMTSLQHRAFTGNEFDAEAGSQPLPLLPHVADYRTDAFQQYRFYLDARNTLEEICSQLGLVPACEQLQSRLKAALKPQADPELTWSVMEWYEGVRAAMEAEDYNSVRALIKQQGVTSADPDEAEGEAAEGADAQEGEQQQQEGDDTQLGVTPVMSEQQEMVVDGGGEGHEDGDVQHAAAGEQLLMLTGHVDADMVMEELQRYGQLHAEGGGGGGAGGDEEEVGLDEDVRALIQEPLPDLGLTMTSEGSGKEDDQGMDAQVKVEEGMGHKGDLGNEGLSQQQHEIEVVPL